MSRYALAAAAALSSMLASSAAMAATASGSAFEVSVSVVAACTVTTNLSDFSFSSLHTASTVAPASREFTAKITCGADLPFNVRLESSSNSYASGSYNMINGTSKFPYTVTTAGSVNVNPTTAVGSFTGAGTSATDVKLTFTPGALPSPLLVGKYSDTLTLKIDF